MPDPISSSNPSRPLDETLTDPTLDDAGQVCRGDVNASSAPPPASSTSSQPSTSSSQPSPTPSGVPKLLAAAAPAPAALPPPASAASPGQTNAERTTALGRRVVGYYDSGSTGGAYPSKYVGVAALKAVDPKTGHELEFLSASAQVGWQNELQVGALRASVPGKNGKVSIEGFTARAAMGVHNDDGSTGLNFALQATTASIEGTTAKQGDTLTAGFSAGLGLAASVGRRDADADGKPEYCWRAAFEIFTLGACLEVP